LTLKPLTIKQITEFETYTWSSFMHINVAVTDEDPSAPLASLSSAWTLLGLNPGLKVGNP